VIFQPRLVPKPSPDIREAASAESISAYEESIFDRPTDQTRRERDRRRRKVVFDVRQRRHQVSVLKTFSVRNL
jgi:hypothetical protein